MRYLQAACDRFHPIPDPQGSNRTCYISNCNLFESYDLKRIMEDPKFLFIHNNIVYFK
jgi:hypothetical protein